MYADAFEECRKMKTCDDWGWLYAVSGRRDEARSIIQRMVDNPTGAYVDPFDVALAYVGLGEKEQAFNWLEKSYEARSTGMVVTKVQPFLDPLRSDPRFQDLLRRMNFPE